MQSDLEHLRQLGIRRFFVYHPFDISDADWTALRDSVQGVQLFAETTLIGHAAAAHFDGVYTYDIVNHRGSHLRPVL